MAALNISSTHTPTPDRITDTREILTRMNVSSDTLRRLEKKGLFPKRQTIGLRKKGLPESVFAAWLATRAPADTQ
jgi:predicted DNA-binding transcriptional regulator AlpA